MGREIHGNPMAVPQDEALRGFLENVCAILEGQIGYSPYP